MSFLFHKKTDEEKREEAADKAAKTIAERERRAGARKGMVEGSYQRGVSEGRKAAVAPKKQGGIGAVFGALGNLGTNYSPPPGFSMGPTTTKRGKGKKRKAEDPFAGFY